MYRAQWGSPFNASLDGCLTGKGSFDKPRAGRYFRLLCASIPRSTTSRLVIDRVRVMLLRELTLTKTYNNIRVPLLLAA